MYNNINAYYNFAINNINSWAIAGVGQSYGSNISALYIWTQIGPMIFTTNKY